MKYVKINLKQKVQQEFTVMNVVDNQNTMSWKEYKSEALKCMLVCSNCHKEIHYKLGYVYSKT